MSRPIKIPLHGLLLQISFYTSVYNYTTVFFFFFFSLSFLPRDFLSVDKKKERRHYRSVTAFIGENRPGYSPRIKARRNEFAKYDPAERTWCFSLIARPTKRFHTGRKYYCRALSIITVGAHLRNGL